MLVEKILKWQRRLKYSYKSDTIAAILSINYNNMKVILLKRVPKVGDKYEVKNVSDGYALNFLIPQKLGVAATAAELKRIDTLKSQEELDKKVKADLLAKNIASIQAISVSLTEKANEKGHLFSSIHAAEIVAAVKEQARVDIDPSFIALEKPIKEVGEHKIRISVGDTNAEFTLTVNAA